MKIYQKAKSKFDVMVKRDETREEPFYRSKTGIRWKETKRRDGRKEAGSEESDQKQSSF